MAIVGSHILLACGLFWAQVTSSAPSSLPPSPPAGSHTPAGGDGVAAARAAAQAALAHGNQSLKEGDADGAVADYRRAQGIYPPAAAKIEFNIAKAEQQRGDQAAAASAFERFLSQSLEIPPEFREEASGELRRLAAALGALKVVGKRPGLLVSIDGQAQGKTPLPGNLWVRPGRRAVTVSEGDKVAFHETVEVAAGATVEVDVTVKVAAAPPETIRKSADAGVKASSAVSLAPANPESPAPAPVLDGPTPPEPATGAPSPLWKKWWFWAAAGAVVAGTITIFLVADRCPANTSCMPASLQNP